MNRNVWRAWAAAAAVWAGTSRADVTNLSVQADTFVLGDQTGNNAGGHTHVAAGMAGGGGLRRGLFRFDLSGLPTGAVVTSAAFRVNVVGDPLFGDVDSTFSLHRVSANWGEGLQIGNQGAPAGAGEATWMERFGGASSWTTAGGDFEASALAETFVSGAAAYEWSGPALAATVQAWLDDPATNAGLILLTRLEGTGRTARRFGSREGGAPAALVVGFDPPAPPAPPAVAAIDLFAGGMPGLAWSNRADRMYEVQYAPRAGGTQDWRTAEAHLAAAGSGTNQWTEPPVWAGPLVHSNALFYRVREGAVSPTGLPLRLEVVASNLVSPTAIAHAGDGSDRLFVAEQTGAIRILDAARNLLPAPFLDLSARMTNLTPRAGSPGIDPTYDERGLLGLAFHPGYASNRRFYVYYSAPKSGPGINHESIVAEFLASATNANVADPASERVVLRFDQPEFNHNGGALAFGPDGFLYIASGDGGGAGDAHPPTGNGQNTGTLLGKILRIDMDGGLPYAIPADNPFAAGPGADEIFAYGLRNPWKFSFDGTNLWVADVGQNLWEEINVVRRGGNYGWRIVEGHHAYDPGLAATVGVALAALDYPVHEYRHGPAGISVIGGFVYRGTNYPALQGHYVFGDFSTSFGAADGAVYYLRATRPDAPPERVPFWLAPSGGRLGRYVKSFGADEAGELYVASTTNLGPRGTSGDLRQLLPP